MTNPVGKPRFLTESLTLIAPGACRLTCLPWGEARRPESFTACFRLYRFQKE